jgi:hypothetical protein
MNRATDESVVHISSFDIKLSRRCRTGIASTTSVSPRWRMLNRSNRLCEDDLRGTLRRGWQQCLPVCRAIPRHGVASALPSRHGIHHPETSKVGCNSLSDCAKLYCTTTPLCTVLGPHDPSETSVSGVHPFYLPQTIAARPLYPESCRGSRREARLLRAISGLVQRSKQYLYSITSSAVASSVCGTVRPSAFAVVRLMMRSNLVGCSTGRSAGLAPRRILST